MTNKKIEYISITDILLNMPVKIFVYLLLGIMFFCWLITISIVMLIVKFT
jgi:hypothetical protein